MTETKKTQFPVRSVLFVSSEVYPYAKTGGLADVSSALPQALREYKHDVRIIMPKYGFIGEKKQKIHIINRTQGMEFNIGGKMATVNAKSSAILTPKTRVQIYLAECEEYFSRMGLYGDPDTGVDYPDNDERFLTFNLGVLELCRRLLWKPDIIHCNDWQSGLIPLLLKDSLKTDPFFANTKTVFTIHNLAYQGNFPAQSYMKTGLPAEYFSPNGVEFYEKFSFLKAGLTYADAITTVSETYAEEIRTKEFGCGMEGLLTKRKKDLYGITNGIDMAVWDPMKDVYTAKKFNVDSIESKEECKKDLCSAFDLPYEEGKPIVAMIARFVPQKGVDLVLENIEHLLKSGAQIIMLGSGDKKYEEAFSKLQKKHAKQFALYLGFHDGFAHKIEAGADIFLIPSAYEPCGLNQMYSMHYGTIPVARRTGGLADTVIDLDEGTKKKPATGFLFDKYDAKSFAKALDRALATYHKHPEKWRELQRNGMTSDFSWDNSAYKYAEVYEKVLAKKD
ncbi:MAG TPA: glycogen synthase GlgA [Candidatus Kapabacteria bacterium]|nr:glycogen synthase GlgA [Candidatus Kapabacteria bacterium]